MTLPMQDIRVLDLARAVSGPYVGRALCDLGADVVKVEWPGGDVSNAFGLHRAGRSGLYTQMNAGKRSVAIDHRVESGAHLVRRLAENVDVVVENFRPGVLEASGLGYRQLSEQNRGLIMLSISGFGQTGPEAQRRAFAPVIHAESGLLGRQAEVDSRSVTDLCLALADTLSGLHGTVAVLAALHARAQTGAGQHIDLSMLDAMIASDDYAHNAIDEIYDIYPARGEVWDAPGGPIMVAADSKTLWVKFSRHTGAEDADPAASAEVKRDARLAAFGAWLQSFDDRDVLLAQLDAADLPWADVRTTSTLLDSPTLVERDVFTFVDDHAGGQRGVVRMPYRFSDAECGVRGPSPLPGEHNASVLQDWLGLDASEIEALAASGALLDARSNR